MHGFLVLVLAAASIVSIALLWLFVGLSFEFPRRDAYYRGDITEIAAAVAIACASTPAVQALSMMGIIEGGRRWAASAVMVVAVTVATIPFWGLLTGNGLTDWIMMSLIGGGLFFMPAVPMMLPATGPSGAKVSGGWVLCGIGIAAMGFGAVGAVFTVQTDAELLPYFAGLAICGFWLLVAGRLLALEGRMPSVEAPARDASGSLAMLDRLFVEGIVDEQHRRSWRRRLEASGVEYEERRRQWTRGSRLARVAGPLAQFGAAGAALGGLAGVILYSMFARCVIADCYEVYTFSLFVSPLTIAWWSVLMGVTSLLLAGWARAKAGGTEQTLEAAFRAASASLDASEEEFLLSARSAALTQRHVGAPPQPRSPTARARVDP